MDTLNEHSYTHEVDETAFWSPSGGVDRSSWDRFGHGQWQLRIYPLDLVTVSATTRDDFGDKTQCLRATKQLCATLLGAPSWYELEPTEITSYYAPMRVSITDGAFFGGVRMWLSPAAD